MYEKSAVNKIFNGGRAKYFPLRSGTRQECSFHHFYSAYYWKFYPEQLSNKRKEKVFKSEGSKIIFVHR